MGPLIAQITKVAQTAQIAHYFAYQDVSHHTLLKYFLGVATSVSCIHRHYLVYYHMKEEAINITG